jgi:hypothetical protein
MKHGVISRQAWLVIVMLAFFQAGCSGINSKRMVPEQGERSAPRFDYSLKIVQPVGGQKSVFGVQDYVENGEFHDALMNTMTGSGLFSSVTDKGGADRELHSEIIAVAPSGGYNMTFAFVTQYWIIDPATGDEVWRKGVNARHEVKVTETWSGSARAVQALEGAVRKNLQRLVEELSNAEL